MSRIRTSMYFAVIPFLFAASVRAEEDLNAIEITVEVVDGETGRPIADASVAIRYRSEYGKQSWTRIRDVEPGSVAYSLGGRTDREGRTVLRVEGGLGDDYRLQITCEGYSDAMMTRAGSDLADGVVRIEMIPTALVGGAVTDEIGAGIAGVRIQITDLTETGDNGVRHSRHVKPIETDDNGRWETQQLSASPNELSILVAHPDYIPYREFLWGGKLETVLEALHEGTWTVELNRGALLEILVTDAESRPLSGVRMALGRKTQRSFPTDYFRSMTTRLDGLFRVGMIQPNEYRVLVRHPDYAAEIVEFDLRENSDPIVVRLTEPGQVIQGRVVDATGTGIPGATIHVEDPWGTSFGGPADDDLHTTSATGDFAIPGCPWEPIELLISKDGFMETRDYPVQAGFGPYEIALQEVLVISGQVFDAETGAPVTEFSTVPGQQYILGGDVYYVVLSGEAVDSPDGYFEVSFVRPAAGYAIRILADGYFPGELAVVAADDPVQLFEIRLERAEPWHGIAVNKLNEPVREALVEWMSPRRRKSFDPWDYKYCERRPNCTMTDEEGRFLLRPQPLDGSLVFMGKREWASVPAAEFERGARVVLEPWARIEGVLRIGSRVGAGREIAIRIDDEFGQRFGGINIAPVDTDAAGRFVFGRVPAVPLTIGMMTRADDRYYETYSVALHPEPGQHLEIAIGGGGCQVFGMLEYPVDVQPGLTHIRGTVMDEKLSEVSYACVVLTDGTFYIEDLPRGTYGIAFEMFERDDPESFDGTRRAGWGFVSVTVPDDCEDTDVGSVAISRLHGIGEGDKAPAIEARQLDGGPLRWDDFEGQLVAVQFGASWCRECVGQLEELKTVWEEYGENRNFGMVSLWLEPSSAAAKQIVAVNGLEWPQGHLGSWHRDRVAKSFGVYGMPSSLGGYGCGSDESYASDDSVMHVPALFLIDTDGTILGKHRHVSSLRSSISSILDP